MKDIWYIFVIGYIILNVVFVQNQKKALNKSKNDSAILVLFQLLSGLVALIYTFLFKFKMSTNVIHYVMLLIAYIFYALYDVCNIKSRKNLEVSTASVLSQLSTIFVFIFGLTLFKEEFVLNKVFGALFILMGNVLVLYKKGKFIWNNYIVFALLANLFNAIAVSIDAGVSNYFNLAIYVSQSLIVPALFVMLFNQIGLKKLKEEYSVGDKKSIWLVAFSWGISIIMMLKAYEYNDVTVVAPLCALGIIFNVFTAYFYQKEKDNLLKKIIAAILVLIGILLIK